MIKNEENKENIINRRLNIVCCGLFLYNNIFNGFFLSCIFFFFFRKVSCLGKSEKIKNFLWVDE